MSNLAPISLTVAAAPELARLVRMTARNAGLLASMTLDRVEDVRMAAEEAFVFACSAAHGAPVTIDFSVDDTHVGMTFDCGDAVFPEPSEEDPSAAYIDLILASVCDSYEKEESPARLILDLKADA